MPPFSKTQVAELKLNNVGFSCSLCLGNQKYGCPKIGNIWKCWKGRNAQSSTGYELQGSLYDQPKQCTIIREIPQNYHTFAWFDPRKIGSLMTPEIFRSIFGASRINISDAMGVRLRRNSWLVPWEAENDAMDIDSHRFRNKCNYIIPTL